MTYVRQQGGTEDSGFTLAELSIVVLIIGILLGIAIASFVYADRQATKISCLSNQKILEDTCAAYALDHNGEYPDVMEELKPYVANYDSIIPCTADDEVLLQYTKTANGVDITCINHPR